MIVRQFRSLVKRSNVILSQQILQFCEILAIIPIYLSLTVSNPFRFGHLKFFQNPIVCLKHLFLSVPERVNNCSCYWNTDAVSMKNPAGISFICKKILPVKILSSPTKNLVTSYRQIVHRKDRCYVYLKSIGVVLSIIFPAKIVRLPLTSSD